MVEKEEILEKIMSGLSVAQKAAVESDEKHIRILAGAGAGKTETLTRKVLYLLLYKGVKPEGIVAFTFTEKAAQSMKSRIYSRVADLMGEEYASKLGKMYIGTIHSFALRILQDYFGYGNYDVLDENQEMAFIMRRGWNIGVQNLDGNNYGKKCKKFIESANVIYDELIDREKLKSENPDFYKVFEKYEEKLNEYRRLTFSRLIYLALSEINRQQGGLPKVKYLIVDEYQDINRAQEELIKLVGKDAYIMIVGDPRQTIYQWRGSDDSCFERFANELYPDTKKITIPENRRSGKRIVDIGNSIASTFENRTFEPMKNFRKNDGYVYVASFETPKEEAKWIADQIKYLVEKENLSYSNFGILLRSVSTSAKPFIEEFKRKDIPYLVGGTVGLFKREEAKAVGKLFVWLYEEGFWKDFEETLEHGQLVNSALQDWNDATGLIPDKDKEKVKDMLNTWREKVLNKKYHTFQEVYHALLDILKFRELDPKNKLHAAIMANLGRFSNLLGDYENAVRLGGNKFSLNKSVLKGLMWYLNFYASGAYEEQVGYDQRGAETVQITTIHQAKGLEWLVVFIPALVDRRFPSIYVGESGEWFISRDLFPAERYDTKEDDERRLFYVAVTRTQSTLVLSHFRRKKNSMKISKFLEELLLKNPRTIECISASKKVNVDKEFRRPTETEISVFDAGELVDYTKCPYFYWLRHVWNYDAPLNEEIGYGKALHYCLRKAVELHKNEGYNLLSAILEAVEKGFHLPYAPKAKAEKLKEAAKRMLRSYVEKNIGDIESVAEVEYRVEYPRKNAVIAGKVDVIIDREGETEIREYKTSRKVTTPEQAAFQVKLYALGLEGFGFNVKKGSCAYLEEGNIDLVNVDENELLAAKQKAEKTIGTINNQKCGAKPGEFCAICDFSNICKWSAKQVVNK